MAWHRIMGHLMLVKGAKSEDGEAGCNVIIPDPVFGELIIHMDDEESQPSLWLGIKKEG